MDQVAPPLFKQGPSAFARLFFFAVLALTLIVADTRFDALRYVRIGLGTALYPVQRGVLAPTQWAGNFFGYFRSLDRVEAQNRQLAIEKNTLAQTALRAESLEAENVHLRKLAGLREGLHAKSVAAEILYDARDPFSRKVIIDRGTQDGVERGQPVIDESGVVGQITRVFPLSSEITLLTDREQAIAVQNVRTGVRGIAYGNAAGGSAGQIDLRFMPSNVDVRKDDLLATSGLDGVFPDGLPVARVLSVERNAAYQFARILCTPMGGTERNRHVLVLLTARPDPRPVDEVPVVNPKAKRNKMP
ncbi:MAG: rod shape-determining protein MreC [Burkholderiaceae bacterium]